MDSRHGLRRRWLLRFPGSLTGFAWDCRLGIVHWEARCRSLVFCRRTGVVLKEAENDVKGATHALEERHGIANILHLSLSGKWVTFTCQNNVRQLSA